MRLTAAVSHRRPASGAASTRPPRPPPPRSLAVAPTGPPESGVGQRVAQDPGELVPLDRGTRRGPWSSGSRDTWRPRRPAARPRPAPAPASGAVQDVALDPTPVTPVPAARAPRTPPRSRPGLARRRGRPSPARATRYVSRSNRSTQLVALVVEVGVDREPAVGLPLAPEPAVEVRLGSIGRHRQLAGERQALVAEPVDRARAGCGSTRSPSGPSPPGPRSAPRDRRASGRSSATSSAIIPPSEPPVTSANGSMPSASASAHSARASSRGGDGGERARRRAGRSPGRSTWGPSTRSGRRAGSRTGRRPASVSSARPGPMSGAHQSPAASADPVSAWTTRTCGASGPGPVVAVGEREGQARAAGLEGRPPRSAASIRPAPSERPGGWDKRGFGAR